MRSPRRLPKLFNAFSWSRLGRAWLALAFPKQCLGCNGRLKETEVFCPHCFEQVAWLAPPFCPTCGEPQMACRGHQQAGPLTGVWALAWHQGLLARLIERFKYEKQHMLAAGLASLLRQNPLGWERAGFDILAPVPLHFKRIRARGFNQAALLGKGLGYTELSLDLLLRVKDQPPQVGLSKAQRRENVRGIFILNPRRQQVRERSVLLLDDVWTTGATMHECARVLLRAGASRVGALTLTRAPLEQSLEYSGGKE